ncbi:Sfi1 spindle body protein-domain-containing protein [Schizophyllum fasciatum]
MPAFNPTRASPPARVLDLAASLSQDISRTSTVSVPELAALSPDEIELLESVIQRAGSNANTFLTVFKAYNDVLTERGLDPHEVIYYGKLLKLGTLKGRNWADKWESVKSQYGYAARRAPVRAKASQPKPKPPSPRRVPVRAPPRINDSFTLDTLHQDVFTDATNSEVDTTPAMPRSYPTRSRLPPRRTPSPARSSMTNSLGLEFDEHPLLNYPAAQPSMPPILQRRGNFYESSDTGSTDDVFQAPSTIPPSYGAAVRDEDATPVKPKIRATRTAQVTKPVIPKDLEKRPASTPATDQLSVARQMVAEARKRRGSVVNGEDAFKKIQMEHDEKNAAQFYEDRLMERCWRVWREGYEWIITTDMQIAEARDNLILRKCVQQWREKTAKEQDLYERVTLLSNKRCLRTFFNKWRTRTREKQQAEWRNAMRRKIKLVRDHREQRLQKDAWTKWRQAFTLRLAEQHHAQKTVQNFFRLWKQRLVGLDERDAIADEFQGASEERMLARSWKAWRRSLQLQRLEHDMSDHVAQRLVGEAMTIWKRRTAELQLADELHDKMIMKNAMRGWKAARDSIRKMESKARKQLALRDEIMIRAIWRVWKAGERGRLLDRVRSSRLVADAFAVWQQRLGQQQSLEARAIAFYSRPASSSAVLALHTWRQHYQTHTNANAYAVKYHASQVKYHAFRQWCRAIHEHAKANRRARKANKLLSTRRAWQMWREKVAERARLRKLEDLERQRCHKIFKDWLARARTQRRRKLAEELVADRVRKRVMHETLVQWTNRVIGVKLRELEVAQQRDATALCNAFKKWKSVCERHVEELNLMESYQFVKREEFVRRVFSRWLTAARASRHRRVVLQEREADMKLVILSSAWDKWREKFKNERLRPIENTVVLQGQQYLLYRAFAFWHSRTTSLPAIRFHANNLKASYWKKWMAAMPRALQAKKAREVHKQNLLTKFFEKWAQKRETKRALRLAARARYLALPTAVSRNPRPPFASTSPPKPSPFARQRSPEAQDGEEEKPEAEPRRPERPFGYKPRAGLASLLTSRPSTKSAATAESSTRPVGESSTRPALGRLRNTSPTSTHTRVRSRPLATSSSASSSRASSPPARPPRSTISTRRKSPSPTESPASRPRSPLNERGRSPSRPPSTAAGSSRLWTELQAVQRKSRPPSERSSRR